MGVFFLFTDQLIFIAAIVMLMFLCFLSANQYTFVTAIVMGMLLFSQVRVFSSSAAFTVRADKSTLLPTRAAVSNNTAIRFPLSFHFFIIPFLLSELWCSYTSCPHKDILLFSSHVQINTMNKSIMKSIMNFCLSFYTVTQLYCTKKVLFLQEFFMYRQMNRESWRMPLSHSVSSN